MASQTRRRIFFHKPSSPNQQIDSLDGLRGIAFLFVIFSHMSNEGIHILPGLDFSGGGRYGVYLFFALSSFLLTLTLIQKPLKQFLDINLWRRYFTRRFLRIFPPYVVVLLISYMCVSIFGLRNFAVFSFEDVVWHIALLKGYGVFWTIPVEFKFYFALPVVAFVLAAASRNRMCVVFLLMSAGIFSVVLIHWPTHKWEIGEVALWPYLPIFLAGSLTALMHSRLARAEGVKSIYVKILFEGMSALIFLVIFILIPHFWSLFAGKYYGAFNPSTDFLQIGFLWSCFIFFYLNGIGFIRKILESRLLRFTGIVSFSAYLWHMPIIYFIRDNGPPHASLVALLILASILVVAAILHIAIEKPFMKIALHKHTPKT